MRSRAVSKARAPRFPQAERQYLVEAVRYVNRVTLVTELDSPEDLTGCPAIAGERTVAETCRSPSSGPWTRPTTPRPSAPSARPTGSAIASSPPPTWPGFQKTGIRGQGSGIRATVVRRPSSVVRRPSVIVTGCYDWLHSGHVRFFEEASSYGDLIVAAGNDANVRNLKGEGHPLQTQEERRYMIGAIRYVKLALITTGWGWLDAEPEIARLKPDIYLVNEDGDKPEKREFCETHGLRYVVLKRTPKAGLPRRSSTDLRGF